MRAKSAGLDSAATVRGLLHAWHVALLCAWQADSPNWLQLMQDGHTQRRLGRGGQTL